ncbi:CcdB family protein [Phenylobacterium sp.]|uniref:CcdB family protein n=1 Tax=Phenylobacterium sp. TaxID=1871053 RepID=UPI00301DC0D9
MRQFDVYESPTEASRRIAPFLVVLQSHFLEGLPTVIVAPLLRRAERPRYLAVGLDVEFADEELVLSVAEMLAVDRGVLRRRRGDLRMREDEIRRALDRVFTGF